MNYVDKQNKIVYIIYDSREMEFVHQYKTHQGNRYKGIFESRDRCKKVCNDLNDGLDDTRYKPYELRV